MYGEIDLVDLLERLEHTTKIAGGLSELWNFGNDNTDDLKTLDAIEVMCKRTEYLIGAIRNKVEKERKILSL